MKKIIFLFLSISSILLAEDRENQYCQDDKKNAEISDKMEKGYENAAWAAVEIGAGALIITRDPLSGAVVIGGGILHAKESYRDFSEARRIMNEQNQTESNNSASNPEPYSSADFDRQ